MATDGGGGVMDGRARKNRLPGDGDSFTALLAILIARARSVGNVAYLFV